MSENNDDHFRIIGSGESNWRVEMATVDATALTQEDFGASLPVTWIETCKGDFLSCVNWVNDIIQLG